MRKDYEINVDGARLESLILEVLLDIRELLLEKKNEGNIQKDLPSVRGSSKR